MPFQTQEGFRAELDENSWRTLTGKSPVCCYQGSVSGILGSLHKVEFKSLWHWLWCPCSLLFRRPDLLPVEQLTQTSEISCCPCGSYKFFPSPLKELGWKQFLSSEELWHTFPWHQKMPYQTAWQGAALQKMSNILKTCLRTLSARVQGELG